MDTLWIKGAISIQNVAKHLTKIILICCRWETPEADVCQLWYNVFWHTFPEIEILIFVLGGAMPYICGSLC